MPSLFYFIFYSRGFKIELCQRFYAQNIRIHPIFVKLIARLGRDLNYVTYLGEINDFDIISLNNIGDMINEIVHTTEIFILYKACEVSLFHCVVVGRLQENSINFM